MAPIQPGPRRHQLFITLPSKNVRFGMSIDYELFFLADCPTQDINAWCSPISVSVGFENGVWALSKMDKNRQKQPKTVILPVLWIVLSSLVGIVTDLPLPQVVVRSVSCDISGYRVSSWGTSKSISSGSLGFDYKPGYKPCDLL